MSEYEVGDRVIITVEYERIVAEVDCHAGGTDYQLDRNIPAGGRQVGWRKAENQPKKKRRSRRHTCADHPEVGAAHACARCRVGRRDKCILLEPHS